MLVASWNVNSIRARLDRALDWLDRVQPDVVCMQETKVTDDKFPNGLFAERGYESAFWGQKTYNGVAILSRTPLSDVQRGFDAAGGDEDARLLAATVQGVRVYSCYVPNGKVIGTPDADEKLHWLERLGTQLDRHQAGDAFVVCGDFNVAWDDRDVHDPVFWRTQVLYHPSMQTALHAFADGRVVDTFRLHHQDTGTFSWWDYRMLGFQKGRGLRIDYVFASEALAARCSDAWIDRNERKGKSPSDHAPVLARFELAGSPTGPASA